MNTQIVFLRSTDRLIYSDDKSNYYEYDANVSPADYVKDCTQKACFILSDDYHQTPGSRLINVYPAFITDSLDTGDTKIEFLRGYSCIYKNPQSEREIATNNKWVTQRKK